MNTQVRHDSRGARTDQPLSTFYASPERACREMVLQQLRHFVAHARVAEVLDATAEVVCVLNTDRQVVFLNQSAVQAFGATTREEVLGLRFGEASGCVHATEMPAGCGTSRACSQCGAARAITQSLKGRVSEEECRIARSGTREPLDLLVRSTSLLVDGQQFLVLTIRDISDHKRRRALERIFFHDVLNTAGSLSGYAELLVDARGRDIDEFRTTMHSLADQILEEIQAQQALSMAEHGELQLVVRPLTTEHLIRSTVRQFVRTADANGKTIRITPAAERLVVDSDEVILRRVFGNMIKNALEATRTGSAVTVGCSSLGPHARLWVHNPEYIPTEIQLQIFQRSFSTKGRDRGLGTYSMKLLVERYLGGRVTFESTEELGTIFCADIPLSPALN